MDAHSNLGGPRRMRVISDGGQQLSTSYYVTMNGRGKRTMTFVNNLDDGRAVGLLSLFGRTSLIRSESTSCLNLYSSRVSKAHTTTYTETSRKCIIVQENMQVCRYSSIAL